MTRGNVMSAPNTLAACVLTGEEADAGGVCVAHGETACVITVELPDPINECVIPGFHCTHDHHISPVRRWPPIPEQRQRS